MATTLTINGKPHDVAASPETPLLWVLRGDLQMTATKYGCGMALCGACTVQVDGVPTRSCVTPISALGTANVATIDAITGPEIDALRRAWTEVDVVQCGYCQGGQLLSAAALLKATPQPTDTEIDAAMDGNLCRCGTYPRIRAAIRRAAQILVA